MSYAQSTSVDTGRTRAEIEKLLKRAGASQFVAGWEEGGAAVMFALKDRRVRFRITIPEENSYAARTQERRRMMAAAEERRRWRVLLLVLKAKLESVESGVESFEEAFLAHLIVPGGKTFGEMAIPQIAEAYRTGVAMPPLLGSGDAPRASRKRSEMDT